MFKSLKLWFTDREHYYQRKRYGKLQKEYRNKLIKQAKEFCPWSGWYMNEMVKTMLEFYHRTYTAGDNCWSEESRIKKIANQVEKALQAAQNLDTYEDLGADELIALAEKEPGFLKYLEKWEKKTGLKTDKADRKYLLYGVAEAYFEKKYTTALYDAIGKHIWEWCD
jgi:hypothetical protein